MKPEKFVLFLILIMLIQIKITTESCLGCYSCNETTGKCDQCLSGYRSSQSFPSNCYKCTPSTNIKDNYFIFNYTTSPPTCFFVKECNSTDLSEAKILYNTGECVTECPPNTFLFNGVCYNDQCPVNTHLNSEPNMTKPTECVCSYKYVYDSTKNTYNCLYEDEPCPKDYPYYNGTDNECYSTNISPDFYVRIVVSKGITNYQLINECNENEYNYTNNTLSACVKDCKSTDLPYHYLNDSKCISKCDAGDFVYENTKTCYKSYTECPTSLNQIQSSPSEPHKCVDYEYCSDSEYIYLYELSNTCLLNCSENVSLITNVIADPLYELIEISSKDASKLIKKCVTKCPYEKPFLDEYETGHYRCVSQCGLDGMRVFTYNNTCYDSCEKVPGYEYTTIDTRECVSECPDGYYTSLNTSDKTCYKSCFFLENYDYHYNNTCVSRDNCTFYVNDGKNLCYSSCPSTAPFHNLGDTKCFASIYGCNDPNNDPTFVYREINEPYICESQCNDTKNYTTEDLYCLTSQDCIDSYPYEYNSKCYKNKCPFDNMKYYYISGLKQCYFDSNCTGENYTQDGECVSQCDKIKYPYSIEPEGDNPGFCLKDIKECYNMSYIYINESRQCMRNCSNGYSIQFEPGTFHPYERDAGNCLSSCPIDFPYEANKICYKDGCPNGYYAQNTSESGVFLCETKCLNESHYVYQDKLCVADCRDTSDVFHVQTNGLILNKCYNKCPGDMPYYFSSDNECKYNCGGGNYFDPETKECFKNCSEAADQIKIFSFESSSTASYANPCLSSCPDGYHYIVNSSDLFCISSCPDGYFYSSKDNKQCVPFCEVDDKLGYNNECVKQCPDFYYLSRENSSDVRFQTICTNNCTFTALNETGDSMKFNYVVNSTKECVEKCPSVENYLYEYQCFTKCPDDAPYFYENEDGDNVCSFACPDEKPYFIEDRYECLSNCSKPDLFKIEDSYVCLSKCPKEYPVLDMSDTATNVTICRKICPENLVNEDNICVESCNHTGTGYKPFYDPSTHSCVSKCPERLPYFRKDNQSEVFYECVSMCEETDMILPNYECTVNCTENYNFVGKGNMCKTKCDPLVDGKYYYNTSVDSVYQCVESCRNAPNSQNFVIEGDYECISECPSNHSYESPLGICYTLCSVNPYYPYSLIDTDGKHKCTIECGGDNPYYLDDKVCINKTTCIETYGRVINEYNECALECNQNSSRRFNLEGVCSTSCNDTMSKYSFKDYKCVSKCEYPDNYLRRGKFCDSSCDSKSPFYYSYLPTNESEYDCVSYCPNGTYYYEGQYNCTTCDDYIIQDTNKCAVSCRDLKDEDGNAYYFFEGDPSDSSSTYSNNTCVRECLGTSKPFTLENYTCTDIPCFESSRTNFYYRERDKICLEKCPENYKYNENKTCVINCKVDEFLLHTGECASECDNKTEYIYYIPGENECLKECPKNYYLSGNKCLKSCRTEDSENPFADQGVCVQNCSSDDRLFYIKEFTHGEVDIQQKCLTDCVPNYPYLLNDSGVYQCVGSCPNLYYVTNRDPNIVAKLCKDECEGDTPFLGDDNECLSQCPDDKPYYYNDSSYKNIICLEKCNDTFPYHEINNSHVCIQQCSDSSNSINYEDGECVPRCEQNQYWVNDQDANGNSQKFCFDQCIPQYGLYSTPENECVENCSLGNYTADYANRKCNCLNLYKINETLGFRECYGPTVHSCSVNDDGFIYLKEGTKRCLKYCPTVLSPEDVCLNSTQCPNNTYLTRLSDGNEKCVCKYKSYSDGLNHSICLGENEDCSSSEYPYFIIEIQQCVKTCPPSHPKIFNNYCLKKCPENSEDNNNICTCKKNWYIDPDKKNKDDENEFICLDQSVGCPEKFPFLAPTTKQCLSYCEGTNYIYYNDQCLHTCEYTDNPTKLTRIKEDDPLFKYGNYTCKCDSVWYYEIDNRNVKCFDNDTTSCKDYSLKYMIKDTKRCVNACPSDYPFSFNYECFSDCENDPFRYYGNILKKAENSNNRCDCINPWKAIPDTNERVCEIQPYCTKDTDNTTFSEEYLLIYSTNECVLASECPKDHPLLFNGKCYDGPDSCPKGTYYNSIYAGQCVCDNLWYYKNVSYKGDIQDKHCIDKEINECPIEYSYQVNNTKECISETCESKGSDYYEFSNICYKDKCPLNTKGSETNPNICICDKYRGFWYQYTTDRNHTVCALKSCPKDRPYYIENTLECLHSCYEKKTDDDEDYYLFNNICYEECPKHTTPNKSLKKCLYNALEDAQNLTALYKSVRSDILLIYENFLQPGGYLYQGFNTTLQIYALNKNGVVGSKDAILRSNLSYIDLSNCINQIYESNDMSDNDDIIVVKYDILNNTEQNMLNPVEYEFYSSKTGEQIDTRVCGSHSVSISYPITYVSNKYTNTSTGYFTNSFKEKFEMGKELYKKDNDIDTFDKNNSLYYDICVSCEIEGKDLILKDRFSYLYPNVSLCESNCSYERTDFDEERVYCNCSLKKEFDFLREYKIDVNNSFSVQEINSLQKGPSNVPTMKCLSKLKNSETITKNGAFYYSTIVLAAEIVCCAIGCTVGFSAVSNVISSSFGSSGDNQTNNAFEEIKIQDPSSLPKSNPPKVAIKDDLAANSNNINPSENDQLNRRPSDNNNNEDIMVEFIPPEYVFIFFERRDRGVCKQVERSHIPFKINEKTKRLIQRLPNYKYNSELKGPYSEDQNIIDIVDDSANKEDYNKGALFTSNNNNGPQESEVLSIFDKNHTNKRLSQKNEPKEKDEIMKPKKYSKRTISNKPKEKDDNESFDEHTDDDEKPRNPKDAFITDERLYKAIRKEARLLRAPFEIAFRYETQNIFVLIMTELIDKIYFFRTFLLTKKYEIFAVKLSLYLLYHILLLTVISLFFDIKTIQKIFNKEDYPDLGFYLLYGLLSNIIVWFVYKLLKCLVSNFKRIGQLIKLQNDYEKSKDDRLIKIIEKKKRSFIKSTKIKLVIYFIIAFILVIFCFCYLIMFCGIYTGTKKKVFKAYGISILEIVIIKIIFALILCLLRKASLDTKTKCLYRLTRFLETYFS